MQVLRVFTLSLCILGLHVVAKEASMTSFAKVQQAEKNKQDAIALEIAESVRKSESNLDAVIAKGNLLKEQFQTVEGSDLEINTAYFYWPKDRNALSVKDYELKYSAPSMHNTQAILDFMAKMSSDNYFIQNIEHESISADEDGRNALMKIRFYKMNFNQVTYR